MATSVKVYAFMNDTAFFNRDFTGITAPTVSNIDQGAYCVTNRVSNMFGTQGIIADQRTERIGSHQLYSVAEDYQSSTIGQMLVNADGKTKLDGILSLIYDVDQYATTEDVSKITALKNYEKLENIFSLAEIFANYQYIKSESESETRSVDIIKELDFVKALLTDTDPEKVITVDPVYTTTSGVSEEAYVADRMERSYFKRTNGSEVNTFNISSFARAGIVFHFLAGSYNFDLTIYFGRDYFLENYPLWLITNVVLPCEPSKLYYLLDADKGGYSSISDFATGASQYRAEKMKDIISGGDQTSVIDFQTRYCAHPDIEPSNLFQMTFSVVYKGAEPSYTGTDANVVYVKSAVKKAILATTDAYGNLHTEDGWKEKFPELWGNESFLILPMYSEVVAASTTEDTTHRKGILNYHKIADFITSKLSTYGDREPYARLMLPIWQVTNPANPRYPIVVIPTATSQSALDIETYYPDYLGLYVFSDEATTRQSAQTTAFNKLFDDALSTAINEPDKCKIISEISKTLRWSIFSYGSIEYRIMAKTDDAL